MTSCAIPSEFERLKTLRSYHVLDTGPDAELDDITNLTSNLLGAPICLISIADEHRQWFKSRVGLDLCEVPRKNAFCDFAARGRDLFIVPDACKDERFADHPLVAGEPGIRFYAGMPLIAPSGEALGALCVVDVVPRELSQQEQRTLRSLGRQVMTRLELVRQMRQLKESQASLLAIMKNQRETLHELAESEERWQFALQNSDLGVWDWNVSTNEAVFSERWCTMLGHLPSEVPPQWEEWRKRVHPDDVDATMSVMQSHLDGSASSFVTELRMRAKNDSWRWVQGRGKVVSRTKDGRPLRFVGTHLDVTDLRMAEASLRESELRFRTLVENAPHAIFIQVDGHFVYANKAALALFGVNAADDLLGHMVSRRFHDDHGRRIEEQFNALSRRQHTAVSVDEVVLVSDGSRKHASVSAVPFAYDGKDGVLVFAYDITARKEAEEKLRQQAMLLDKAQDAIIVQDLNHRVLYWNKSAETIYGWSAEEALGQKATAMHLTDTVTCRTAAEATLQAAEWTGEMPQESKTGKKLLIEAQWTLVRDDEGRPKAIMSVNTDITERKLIQKQYLRSQRMESIGTLAGGIAHDLNNVLSPILMSIEVLKLKERDTARLAILSTIERSAARGADMVRQVLAFSRGVESQQLDVKADQVLAEVIKFARETFPKTIQISYDIPPALWIVTGDPTQLHQVLLNLCVNARDAMPNGGKLSLSAHNVVIDEHYAALSRDSKPGPHICLKVEDSGTGMPPEVMEHIFEPFFSTKEVGKGTGLGLSTTMAIVRAHGGFLHVQSELGQGTTFAVYLPAQSTLTESLIPTLAAPENIPAGCGEWVLVVDDESSVRDITRHTLESFGYFVTVAADGAEAAAIYAGRTSDIAVVLIDMMMPVMDGEATIQVLCKLNPEVKIIAASGLNLTRLVGAAETAGTRCFIPKPYTAATLLKALRQVIDEH